MHPVPGPPQPSLSVGALAYDAIATTYDVDVEGDAWMREVLHRHFARVFKAGERVLDVGCGTGIDALFLAHRGVHVVGVDFSPAMIAQLRLRVAAHDRVEAHVLATQDLSQLCAAGERFDGIISAFAGLSTLESSALSAFADVAAELLTPGGRLIVHMLNRFSLWEWLGYLMHADVRRARDVGRLRSRAFTIGGRRVPHTLYFARDAYQTCFSRRFALRDAYALGALRPPHTVRRIPTPIVRGLEWLDVRAGRWPLVERAGRFFVLDLERRAT